MVGLNENIRLFFTFRNNDTGNELGAPMWQNKLEIQLWNSFFPGLSSAPAQCLVSWGLMTKKGRGPDFSFWNDQAYLILLTVFLKNEIWFTYHNMDPF